MTVGFSPPAIRRYERAHLDLYVNKIIGDEPHLARVRDISMGGVYLYKLLEPEVPTGQIGLEIKLPNSDDVIWAVGEVVRQDDSAWADGVAVRFVRIAEHDRELIKSYVESTSHADHTETQV
ncbi:MAG: PilZ domain-containing protein [Deltaproteobacteria bacterium]|nr:PilZ domain-containing protein [Deltaproteobacteria bacterium]